MKVVWMIQNLVPYHHARFDAYCRRSGAEGILVQISDQDVFKVLKFQPTDAAYRLKTLFPGVPAESLSLAKITRELFAFLRQEKPDAVCASGFGIQSGLAMLTAAAKLRLPVIVFTETNQYDFPRHWLTEKFKKILLSGCSAGLGGHDSGAYLEALGIPRDRIFYGYDVVDTRHFVNPAPHEFSQPYFFACARLEEKKNYFRLLEAYAQYRQRTKNTLWPLKIAGDGYLRPQLEEFIRKHDLQNDVTLLGAVKFDDIPAFYWHAGAFFHASTTEQWGLVVNEAMAAGCPVFITKRCGCAADLVKSGVNGGLFDPFSVDEIAETMLRVSALPVEKLTAMGKASEEIIRGWGPDRFAEQLQSAVQKAVQSPRCAGILTRLALQVMQWKGC